MTDASVGQKTLPKKEKVLEGGMDVLFWLAIWVFVAAPLALLVGVLITRMSGDGLPKADPYSGALDPTLLDTDAHRDRQPDEHALSEQPGPRKSITSNFNPALRSGTMGKRPPSVDADAANVTRP